MQLDRLALHYPRQDQTQSHAKLVMQDMIEDLMPYDPQEIAEACTAWRRGNNAFFPKSGQLITLLNNRRETAIPHPGGHARVTFRAQPGEGPRPRLKPWRQILAEKGKALSAALAPEKETAAPALQERLQEDGSLSDERKEQLRALREKLPSTAVPDRPASR